jgi:hypothetical protein
MKAAVRSGWICLLLALVVPPAAMAAGTAPSSGIEAMNYFRGVWDCAGKFPASGKTIASTIRFNAAAGGKVLVGHQDDRPPNAYHAIETWMQKHGSDSFEAAIVDGYSGVREFNSAGWRDKTLTWQSGAGITPDQRFVYTKMDGNTCRLDWGVSNNGSHYHVGDTLTCKRRTSSRD